MSPLPVAGARRRPLPWGFCVGYSGYPQHPHTAPSLPSPQRSVGSYSHLLLCAILPCQGRQLGPQGLQRELPSALISVLPHTIHHCILYSLFCNPPPPKKCVPKGWRSWFSSWFSAVSPLSGTGPGMIQLLSHKTVE